MLDALLDPIRKLMGMRSIDLALPVLDEDALDEAIASPEGIVVCFYADWCGFCRAFMPTFEEKAPALPVDAAAANISDYGDRRWTRFDIDAVPTLIAFRDGEIIARVDGPQGRGLRAEDVDRLIETLPA